MRSSHFEWLHLYRRQSLTKRLSKLQKMLSHVAIELRAIETELACRDESAGSNGADHDDHQPIDDTPIGNLSVDGSVDKYSAKQAQRA